MAESILDGINRRRQHELKSLIGDTVGVTGGESGTRRYMEHLGAEEAATQRKFNIVYAILIALAVFVVIALFSPLGTLVFLRGDAGTGPCPGGGCGGGTEPQCDLYAECDAFVVTSLEAEGATFGLTNSSAPLHVYNDNVTVHANSTITFEPGSTFLCPTTDFLNDCVDNGSAFNPTCDLDYAACGPGAPLTAGNLLVTNHTEFGENSTITFGPGSSVTCPTTDFLNDCVDVGGATYTPTCDEHALCTNFLVQGIDVVAGAVSLQLGATLTTSSGSTVTLVDGATTVFESGSELEFQAGATVTCPTPDFLNDCVDQPATQICGADYDQCNGADPFAVGAVEVDESLTMLFGSTLAFDAGSAVTCPTTGFLNACVDEVGAVTCNEHSGCFDFEVISAIINAGTLTLGAGADLVTTNGTTATFVDGSSLDFQLGSSVTCPTPDFLNDCVNATGGVSFTPTCAADYAGCTSGDPFLVDTVSAGTVETTDLTVGAGGVLTFDAASSVVCPTSDFLNSCVNVTGGASFTPTCASDYAGCTGGDPFVVDTISATTIGTTDLTVSGAGNLDVDGSVLTVENTSFLDLRSSSTFTTEATVTAICASPLFDYASGCTSEPAARRLVAGVFSAAIAPGTTSTSMIFEQPDATVSTLPHVPASFVTYTVQEQGLYTVTVYLAPNLPSGGDWGIQLRRTFIDLGTGDGPSAAGNPIFQHICQYNEGNLVQSPGGMCTYNGYFHVNDTMQFYLNHGVQGAVYQIGNFNNYAERLEIQRISA